MGWVHVIGTIVGGFGLIVMAPRIAGNRTDPMLNRWMWGMLRAIGVMLVVVATVYLLIFEVSEVGLNSGLIVATVVGGFLVFGVGFAILSKRLRRVDSVFGPMRCTPTSPSIWIAETVPFEPTDSTIQLTIEARIDDTFESQHRFFAELGKRYGDLVATARPLVKAEQLRLHLPTDDVVLLEVDVPTDGNVGVEWESIWGNRSGDPSPIAVVMNGWVPIRIAELTDPGEEVPND